MSYMVIIVTLSLMMTVLVFSEVVELTQPEGNTFDGPTNAQGQKSEALTLIVAVHHVTMET